MDVSKDLREVGDLAAWSVASSKPGNGVQLLRDGRNDTFWQSDGPQPHTINIQFQKMMQLAEVHLYMDWKLDESYTPNKISIRAGTGFHDLKEVKLVEFAQPNGWVRIPLTSGLDDDDAKQPTPTAGRVLRAFCVQLAILANHQNGRDAHLRQVRIFGPRVDPLQSLGLPCTLSTTEMRMYATVR